MKFDNNNTLLLTDWVLLAVVPTFPPTTRRTGAPSPSDTLGQPARPGVHDRHRHPSWPWPLQVYQHCDTFRTLSDTQQEQLPHTVCTTVLCDDCGKWWATRDVLLV